MMLSSALIKATSCKASLECGLFGASRVAFFVVPSSCVIPSTFACQEAVEAIPSHLEDSANASDSSEAVGCAEGCLGCGGFLGA